MAANAKMIVSWNVKPVISYTLANVSAMLTASIIRVMRQTIYSNIPEDGHFHIINIFHA
jgi:hypothetical protein